MIQEGNFERAIDRLGLTVDVVLTFTGAGNFTKLRYLNRLQQAGRWVVAGLELSSSALDISLRYSDWCTDKEFCDQLQRYNTYLQLGLLGGEIVSASYKQLIRNELDKTKDLYKQKRQQLADNLGEESADFKAADEAFGPGSSTAWRYWSSSKAESYNDLLYKRSALADRGKDLSADELAELDKLKAELPSHNPIIIESTIAEFPDVPLGKEFTQQIQVKLRDPQPGNDPRYFEMNFKVEDSKITGIKEGYYDYVVTMEGELKIGAGHYFMTNSNEYVKAAGRVELDKLGKIKDVDLNSGHYQPNYEENEIARQLFRDLGLMAN
ncbi:MAG: hypothetical protein AAFQ94_18855 [Bacteroidota bacterium]